MTSAEFAESLAFERLEPDPVERLVRLVAELVTLTANGQLGWAPRKRAQPFKVADILPDPYRSQLSPAEEAATVARVQRQLMEGYLARQAEKERAN